MKLVKQDIEKKFIIIPFNPVVGTRELVGDSLCSNFLALGGLFQSRKLNTLAFIMVQNQTLSIYVRKLW
jgi:hypothetical protein